VEEKFFHLKLVRVQHKKALYSLTLKAGNLSRKNEDALIELSRCQREFNGAGGGAEK